MYSLFGAGMHPATAASVWRIYALPRLVYSLEVMINPPNILEKFEDYQREVMMQLQSLSINSSNAATYLLLGIVPTQGEIEKWILTTFNRLATCVEYEILKRQTAIKSLDSLSWTSSVKKITYKYNLPSVHQILDNPYPKDFWKQKVKKAVMSMKKP